MLYQIDKKETGKRIKELAEQRGLTPTVIKELICLGSTQAVYKWYWGNNLPSVDSLFFLSQLFDVPIDDILVKERK